MKHDELSTLLGALCNGVLQPDEADRLTALLRDDPGARQYYVDYLDVHVTLAEHAKRCLVDAEPAMPDVETLVATGPGRTADSPQPAAARRSRRSYGPYAAWALAASLLIAAVVTWQLRESRKTADANEKGADGLAQATSTDQSASSAASDPAATAPAPYYLAQVTDVSPDTVWGAASESKEFLLRLRQGDSISIESGLVQVEYYAGAALILQGPCRFVATGEDSGRLELGQLTGNVSNGKFFLTTPNAKVIDLGTEFGVAVDDALQTDVCVFNGKVEVVSVQKNVPSSLILTEGMAARIAEEGSVVPIENYDIKEFTRSLAEAASSKVARNELSLVHLLNGWRNGRYRIAGVVAPDTGRPDRLPWLRSDGPGYSLSAGFQPMAWHPFIDGVFIPSVDGRQTQLDSAGHVVDLPASTGRTWGPVWSKSRLDSADSGTPAEDYWGTDTLGGVYARLARCQSGMIGIHSNVGITYDLAAIRQHCGKSLISFRAVCANLDDDATKRHPGWSASKRFPADLRVFVDGELRASRLDFAREEGEVELSAALNESDRFLTIVSTDAGQGEYHNHDAYDHVVLIDPVLSTAEQ